MVEAVAVEEPQTAPKPRAGGDRRHRDAAAEAAKPGIGAAEQIAATGRSATASPPIRMNIGRTDRS